MEEKNIKTIEKRSSRFRKSKKEKPVFTYRIVDKKFAMHGRLIKMMKIARL
ncbi:MAG: hypothetical protein ACPL3A_10625 [Thermoanaerobacteraceae bacterium]